MYNTTRIKRNRQEKEMKINANTNFLNIKETYLFSEIGARVRKYSAENPGVSVISLISGKRLFLSILL